MRAWWRRSRPRPGEEAPASPLLPGLKAHLDALVRAQVAEDQEPALQQAAARFLAAGPDLLHEATPHLWAYYRRTVEGFSREECTACGIPLLDSRTDVWTQVSFVHPPSVEPGKPPYEPADAYLSFEGEVTWEPEHGLQLVVDDGTRVGKVGPYDGHLTNAHAWDDLSLLGTVFRG